MKEMTAARNRILYGTEQPTRFHHWFNFFCFLSIPLIMYGYTADFAVSIVGGFISLSLSSLLAFLTFFTLRRAYQLKLLQWREKTNHGAKVFASLLSLPVFFVAFWLITSRAIPDLYAQMFGEDASVTTELYKETGGSKCPFQVRGQYLNWPPKRICINRDLFQSLPESGVFIISGKSTIFGIHIDDIKST